MTHRTAAVLAAAAALSAPAAAFAPTALPLSQGHGRALRQAAAAPRMGLFDGLLGGGKDSKAVVFKEWTQQDVVDGPKGAGLAGNVDVVFKIGEDVKTTRAFAGAPLSEVAAQVDLKPGAPQPGRPCRLAPVLPRPAPPRPGLLGSAAARLLAPAGGHAHVRARGWLQPGRMRIRSRAHLRVPCVVLLAPRRGDESRWAGRRLHPVQVQEGRVRHLRRAGRRQVGARLPDPHPQRGLLPSQHSSGTHPPDLPALLHLPCPLSSRT